MKTTYPEYVVKDHDLNKSVSFLDKELAKLTYYNLKMQGRDVEWGIVDEAGRYHNYADSHFTCDCCLERVKEDQMDLSQYHRTDGMATTCEQCTENHKELKSSYLFA